MPNQWTTSLIALLPTNAEIERPIALVASLYRLWCKLRATYTQQLQHSIRGIYVWERVVPGTECLNVALKRAFTTEHHKALQRTVISVLLDMSNFYDRIDLEKLSERWLDSDYPATHAALAMQIYCGSRVLEAESEASRPLWTANGILAGDPQAPLAAKIYLHRALHAFSKKYPQLHVDLWIDDLSFDTVDRDPANAVRVAIAAFNYIRKLLEEDNLIISAKKTGFIVANSAAKKLLSGQLPKQGPGLAPQHRARLKAAMGRQLGLQRTGNLDIVYAMKSQRQDPDTAAFHDQVKIFRHFVGQWPEALRKDLERAWAHHQSSASLAR